MPLAEARGGAEVMIRHLVSFRQAGEWSVVFLEDGPMVDEFRKLGVDTHVLSAGRLRHIPSFVRAVRAIANIVRERKAQSVLGWMSKGHIYGGLAALLSGVPATWYQLAMPTSVHWIDRLATAIPASCVLTCSEAGALAQRQIWPHRRVRVVHPGVDLADFDPDTVPSSEEARALLDLPQDVPIVGIIGRLQTWKGMHVFIDAIARVHSDYPDLKGVIVGGKHELEPEYPDQLRLKIESYGLADTIILAGFQPNPATWLSAFDVFVHASDHEPFGLVVIEAMAMGLPVVASDTAGPTEVITHGKDGLLASFGRDELLACEIRRYLDNPSWAAEVSQSAQVRAHDFTAARFANRLYQTVQETIRSIY